MQIPKIVTRKELLDALSNKPDSSVTSTVIYIRRRFAIAVCKNLLGCSVKTAQKRCF